MSTFSTGIIQAIDSRYFHLIIFPTEKCSFRCSYCYEDFKLGRIQADVMDGLKAFLKQRLKNVTSFEVSWFGGEPLLAKDSIYEVHEYIKGLEYNLSIGGNITTNGFHIDLETANNLIRYGVDKFQVSLDGTKETHNLTRLGKGGFPTFDKIWSNLVTMKQISQNFTVILRLHFHPQNIESIKALSKMIENEFQDDGRFKIHFKGINHLGGSNDNKIEVFSYKEQLTLKHELISNLENKTLVYGDEKNQYICYASRMNSLGIRSDGSIIKCTVALNDERNHIGHLKKDGKIEINKEHLSYWTRGIVSGDAATLACPMSSKN